MPRLILIAALLLAPALAAQNTQITTFGSIRTPIILLGSGTTPTIITNPPFVEVPSTELYTPSTEPEVSNAPPANTELLSTTHFDFILSPLDGVLYTIHGHMSDTSFSLGEYARQLRANRRKTPDLSSAPPK